MLTRRTVMLSAAASALANSARAQPAPAVAKPASLPPTVLQLQNRTIEVNGKAAKVYGITQPNGTRGIFTSIGEAFRVRVENHIEEPSLLHWHGLTPPWQQDGVPGVSGPPIPVGGHADYDFPLRFGGTFWMHSHQGLQEQLLMTAPIIIGDGRVRPGEQEVLIQLADFSFTPPEEIFDNLRKGGGMAGMNIASTRGSVQQASGSGNSTAMKSNGLAPAAPPAMSQSMPPSMPPSGMLPAAPQAGPDLNDVKYDAFLANDRTLRDPEVIRVEPGGSVFLRVINSSSMSSYHLDLGALDATLVAVDGFMVAPVKGRVFPVSVAQRLDIRIAIPAGPGAYPVLTTLEGGRARSGIVLQAGNGGRRQGRRAGGCGERRAITLDLERQLRAAAPLAARQADRTHRIDLTGEMAGYVWSLNGVAWNRDVPPLPVAEGERVELVLTNRTAHAAPDASARAPSSRWWRSTGSACRARCATRSRWPRTSRSSSLSTRTTRGSGPFTATCSTTSMRACSPRCATCEGRPGALPLDPVRGLCPLHPHWGLEAPNPHPRCASGRAARMGVWGLQAPAGMQGAEPLAGSRAEPWPPCADSPDPRLVEGALRVDQPTSDIEVPAHLRGQLGDAVEGASEIGIEHVVGTQRSEAVRLVRRVRGSRHSYPC